MRQGCFFLIFRKIIPGCYCRREKKNYIKKGLHLREKSELGPSCEDYKAPFPGEGRRDKVNKISGCKTIYYFLKYNYMYLIPVQALQNVFGYCRVSSARMNMNSVKFFFFFFFFYV